MNEVQLTPAETLALANKVKAEAEASTAAATAATKAANERMWQYEQETFLLRNPSFEDNDANVGIMRTLLAAKGFGWDARSMEYVYRNNLGSFATTAKPTPAAAPEVVTPSSAPSNYGLTPEKIRDMSYGERQDLRQNDKRKFAAIDRVVSDFIANNPNHPGLVRSYLNGARMSEDDLKSLNFGA